MKRDILLIAALAVLLAGILCGCGADKTADLSAFYRTQAEKYGWSDTAMVDLDGEMLESCYPGLKALAERQLVAKMPQMSASVNELVLVECASEEDAAAAAAIMQKRADDQAQGGAWYPDSMDAWGRAKVYTHGRYAAMIASAEHQSELESAFEQALS